MQAGYHDHSRPDVAQLVPVGAQRILDIGCGSGALGRALKDRQDCRVVGIEANRPAALRAMGALDYVVMQDVETLDSLPQVPYDCIILADVLEHLREPEALLHKCREALTPDGTLVVSIPNARNWRVLDGILRGDFSYTDAGLLDRNHLRFFTRRELQKLLYRTGFEQQSLAAVLDPGLQQQPPGCGVMAGRLHVACDSEQEAAEFWTYQYLATATVRQQPPAALTSLIIPCWNQLDYTRLCLESLLRTATLPVEIIAVDNGSTDGTGEYLQALQEAHESVRIISNSENLGWVKGINQGLAAATGDTIILLNNDTVLPTGWLEPLVSTAWQEGVGLVGPLSNNVSGPQCIPVGYDSLEQMDGWAWDFQQGHAGQVADCPRLVGFCLAGRREFFEQVGGLDERFGLGFCDDDDLCRRATAAGWRTVIACGSFVHHWGSASFHQLEDADALLQHNLSLLADKYREDTHETA